MLCANSLLSCLVRAGWCVQGIFAVPLQPCNWGFKLQQRFLSSPAESGARPRARRMKIDQWRRWDTSACTVCTTPCSAQLHNHDAGKYTTKHYIIWRKEEWKTTGNLIQWMYFQHFIQCLKSCATFVKYCIGLCLNGFSKQKIQFIQSQHIISESKSQYNWSGKFNQPFCSRGREHFEIMNLLSRYLNFLICTSSSFLLIQYLKARNTCIHWRVYVVNAPKCRFHYYLLDFSFFRKQYFRNRMWMWRSQHAAKKNLISM